MENQSKEFRKKESRIVSAVKEKMMAFHEQYIHTVPIAQRAQQVFDEVATVVRSQSGKEIVERIRPSVFTFSRLYEVSVESSDVILGLVAGGAGVGGMIGEKRRYGKIDRNMKQMNNSFVGDVVRNESNARWVRNISKIGIGGAFLAIRPLSRVIDAAFRAGTPIARRITQTVDSILLRKELKEAKQVFVGSS